MILTHIDTCRDGGTNRFNGEDGKIYYEDYRIGTKTPGAMYVCYPDDNPDHIVPLEEWKTFVFTILNNYYHQIEKYGHTI